MSGLCLDIACMVEPQAVRKPSSTEQNNQTRTIHNYAVKDTVRGDLILKWEANP